MWINSIVTLLSGRSLPLISHTYKTRSQSSLVLVMLVLTVLLFSSQFETWQLLCVQSTASETLHPTHPDIKVQHY